MAWDRTDLTSDAVQIDGFYLEDCFTESADGAGYFTQGTDGRNPQELELRVEDYLNDGSMLKGSRYGAREIEVRYCLWANSSEQLRKAQNKLMKYFHSAREADFVFNDLPDRFITGTIVADPSVKRHANLIEGSYTIYCKDPYFYSTSLHTVTPSVEDNVATFAIEYEGDVPAYPVLESRFGGVQAGDFNVDGDCGYLAWRDTNDNVIQIGNPYAVDYDATKQAEVYFNRKLDSDTDLNPITTTEGHTWGTYALTGTTTCNISSIDQYYNKGAGLTQLTMQPTFSATDSWHGAGRYYSLPSAGQQNWEMSLTCRYYGTTESMGVMEVGGWSDDGEMIAGFRLCKGGAGNNGYIDYIVNNVSVLHQTFDCSRYNIHFGISNRIPVNQTQYYNTTTKKWQVSKIKGAKTRTVVSGYTYTQPNMYCRIQKRGSQVTFQCGVLGTKTFTDSAIYSKIMTEANVFMSAYKSVAPVFQSLATWRLAGLLGDSFEDQDNIFHAGDTMTADVASGNVLLTAPDMIEGESVLQYGALGNDWETFQLNPGDNIITAEWSNWVTIPPDCVIKYNERYL